MTALQGLRVADLGSFIAGPFAAQQLGDMGADVIKIEPPDGDAMRRWGVNLKDGQSLWWPVIGRNKRSIVVDMKTARGQSLVRDLVLQCDVVIENFRPGTLERLGLDPALLLAARPGLIIARISGFGQTGPYSQRAGFGSVAEAMGGLRYLTGFPDRPPPRAGLSIGDALAGLYATIGILGALHVRDTTGQGQVIDVALSDAVIAVMESVLSEWSATGQVRGRTGSILPRIAPSNLYPTSDGRGIVIGANADAVFRRLCEAMGRPDLTDHPKYATHHARGNNQGELDALISAWTCWYTAAQLDGILEHHGVPAGPVNTAADVAQDPHFRERDAVISLPTQLGTLWMQGVTPRLSRTPGAVRWAGPALGEHTGAILTELLGKKPDEIAALREEGVIR